MKTVALKKVFNKEAFNRGASIFKIGCWYLTNLLCFQSGIIPFNIILINLLRLFGAKIGKEVRIKPAVYVRYPWKLIVGDYCWIADCYIDNLELVTLGKHVCISQQAMLITGNHDYASPDFKLCCRPIIIEDGVWIGARATICPGLTLFSHAVLCAGAVAYTDLSRYSIYQGNPAVRVRKRTIR